MNVAGGKPAEGAPTGSVQQIKATRPGGAHEPWAIRGRHPVSLVCLVWVLLFPIFRPPFFAVSGGHQTHERKRKGTDPRLNRWGEGG